MVVHFFTIHWGNHNFALYPSDQMKGSCTYPLGPIFTDPYPYFFIAGFPIKDGFSQKPKWPNGWFFGFQCLHWLAHPHWWTRTLHIEIVQASAHIWVDFNMTWMGWSYLWDRFSRQTWCELILQVINLEFQKSSSLDCFPKYVLVRK